jgi:thiol-disulfide isomerase/thioredoxin
VRAPVDHITAPRFPANLPWINGSAVRIEDQLGHPVLVEFWDFCRPNSIRTLPYLKAWHERYAGDGLQVIGVHASGFEPSRDLDAVQAAVARLGIPYPVVVDSEHEIWRLYGNLGWPARYLFSARGTLSDYHYGEGGYADTERTIQELLGFERALVAPIRPEDAPDARLAPQSEDVSGTYSGPFRAGGVWAVLDGHGSVTVDGRRLTVDHAGAYELLSFPRSTDGELDLKLSEGVRCHAVCFTPGVAPRPGRAGS